MIFPENYDGMGAKEISIDVQKRADDLVIILNVLEQDIRSISPGPNGEISVEFDYMHGTREVIFYPDKTRIVTFPNNGENPTQKDILLK
jgi:hypothetical protein